MTDATLPRKLKVLTISFSQSGQLDGIVEAIAKPIEYAGIRVVRGNLCPVEPYPFPWPFLTFFNTFPETIYEDAPHAVLFDGEEPLIDTDFDLILLGYQVWFLAPSLPVSSFLKGQQAEQLFADKRVVTVIGCRNMWAMAQERMKLRLAEMGAHLIDNVVLTDSGRAALTFLSTPLWVMTGRQGPWLGGLIPRAGVSPTDRENANRFGIALAKELCERNVTDKRPMLGGLGAVKVNTGLIGAEKAGRRGFQAWGALLRWIGPPSSVARQAVLIFFCVYLVLLICTVVPLATVFRLFSARILRSRHERLRNYYAAPSGE